MSKVESFFTTSVVNNTWGDQCASNLLFAPLHQLLCLVQSEYEVDLNQQRVTPIEKAEWTCQCMAMRVFLLFISIILVIPCTLLGILLKGLACCLDPDNCARYDLIFREQVLQQVDDSTLEDSILPKDLLKQTFTFLSAHDVGSTSQVCKAWRKFSADNVIWGPIFARYSNHEIAPGLSKDTVKALVLDARQQYAPYLDAFGDAHRILQLPEFTLPNNIYMMPVDPLPNTFFYGTAFFQKLLPEQLGNESIVKGVTRTGQLFILIRYVRNLDRPVQPPVINFAGIQLDLGENGPLVAGNKEGLIALLQNPLNSGWTSFAKLWPGSGTGISRGFIDNEQEKQWLTNLLSNQICGPRPNRPYPGLEESGATVTYRLWQPA